MSYSVTVGGFDLLASSWSRLVLDCTGRPVFLTPQWQQAWWRHFGNGEPLLLAVRRNGELAGVAPMMKTESGMSLLGGSNVCDYLDFIALPEFEADVCRAVLGFLRTMTWDAIDLFSLPAESVIRRSFIPLAREAGLVATEEQEDVCPLRDLPSSWEEYLALLPSSGRHELRRKMRRLASLPDLDYEVVSGGESLDADMADFLSLFLDSREAKARFLTPEMENFFRDVARTAASNGWLKLFFLKIGGTRVATAMVFDACDTFYLYNSGYDRRYSNLSVGLLLKAYCIESAISAGRKRFDFLRGREPYKYDLGGIDYPVYRCRISKGAA